MRARLAAVVVASTLASWSALPGLVLAQPAPDREELAKNPRLFLELARKARKWDEPAEPAKIVGPIYAVGTKGLSVFLVRTSEGLILLNTAMPGSGPLIEAAIRKLGFDPKDVRLLLTSHAHVDHVGAHAYFKKLSGARVAVIKEEKDLLESGGKLDFHYGNEPEFAFEPVKADWVFADGDVLKLGDVAITALLTSGHTKGSTTYVMNVADAGKVYTVIFLNGLSINPGYRVAKDPSYLGIQDDYRRSLRTLETLRPDIWLCPHTEAYDFEGKLARSAKDGVKAWVDPDGYRLWLAAQRENLESTVNRELGITRPGPGPGQ